MDKPVSEQIKDAILAALFKEPQGLTSRELNSRVWDRHRDYFPFTDRLWQLVDADLVHVHFSGTFHQFYHYQLTATQWLKMAAAEDTCV